MLGMPFQREQLYNARRMAWMGMGLLVNNSPVMRAKGIAKRARAGPFQEEDIVLALKNVSEGQVEGTHGRVRE